MSQQAMLQNFNTPWDKISNPKKTVDANSVLSKPRFNKAYDMKRQKQQDKKGLH